MSIQDTVASWPTSKLVGVIAASVVAEVTTAADENPYRSHKDEVLLEAMAELDRRIPPPR